MAQKGASARKIPNTTGRGRARSLPALSANSVGRSGPDASRGNDGDTIHLRFFFNNRLEDGTAKIRPTKPRQRPRDIGAVSNDPEVNTHQLWGQLWV